MRAVIVAFLLSFLIFGQPMADVTQGFFELVAPSEWTDGTPLPYEDITAYGIQCDGVADEIVVTKANNSCDAFVPANIGATDCISKGESGMPVSGTYTCRARAFVGITGGKWSNDLTVNFTVAVEAPVIPAAPSNFM